MDSIEQHIEKDKEILEDPTLSPQMRRHTVDELEHLEKFHDAHPEDHHDPTAFEMYCDCLLYTSPSPRDGLLSRMPSSA